MQDRSWFVYGSAGSTDKAFLYDFAQGEWSTVQPKSAFKDDAVLHGSSQAYVAAEIDNRVALLNPTQGKTCSIMSIEAYAGSTSSCEVHVSLSVLCKLPCQSRSLSKTRDNFALQAVR